jgi:hypothetical protein
MNTSLPNRGLCALAIFLSIRYAEAAPTHADAAPVHSAAFSIEQILMAFSRISALWEASCCCRLPARENIRSTLFAASPRHNRVTLLLH